MCRHTNNCGRTTISLRPKRMAASYFPSLLLIPHLGITSSRLIGCGSLAETPPCGKSVATCSNANEVASTIPATICGGSLSTAAMPTPFRTPGKGFVTAGTFGAASGGRTGRGTLCGTSYIASWGSVRSWRASGETALEYTRGLPTYRHTIINPCEGGTVCDRSSPHPCKSPTPR